MYKASHLASGLLFVVLAAGPALASPASQGTPQQQGAAGGPPQPSPESLSRDLAIPVGQSMTISRFQISGNTVYTDDELQSVVKGWAGKPVTAAELLQAVTALKTRYQSEGYAFADVKIPPQQVAGGTLRVEVLEGTVASIKVAGNKRYSTEFLTERVSSGLAPGKVITMPGFQRAVILLNMLPGLQAQIAPAPVGPGRFDVAINVIEDRFKGTYAPDNYIRSQFGNMEMKLTLDFQNVTKRGDSFTFEPAALQKKWPSGFRVAYATPVGNKGTSVSLMFINADFQFITQSALMGLQNKISYTVVNVTHPLKMSFNKNIFFTAGYVHATSAYVLGPTQFGPTEKLDVMTASLLYIQGQPGKATTNLFTQFTGNFRSNPDSTRNNAEPARLDVAGGHERWFDPKTSWFVFGIGVLSKDPLLSSQKVTVGGPFCVRGFDVNEAQGDQGYLIKNELRRQLAMLPRKSPLNVKFMFDHGAVYRKIFDPFFPNPILHDYLASVGVGVNVKLMDRYYFSAEYARRVNNHPVRDGKVNGRVWLSANATF
jgi:hemolysin activation/secretion protein